MKGRELTGYKFVSKCKVCNAISQITGKNIRAEVDASIMRSQRARTGLDVLNEHQVYGVSLRQLQYHIQKHSPFVREENIRSMAEKVSSEIVSQAVEHINAQDALQEIVNIGMGKVKTGEIQVTERLLSTALREANKNQNVTKFEEIAKELDRKLFDRRSIKSEVEERLSARVIEGETA